MEYQWIGEIIMAIAAVGIFFNSFMGLYNGKLEETIGRKHRKKKVTFTGKAGDILSVLGMCAGTVAILAIIAYYTGLISMMAAFFTTAIIVVLFQVIIFVVYLFQRAG